MHLSESHRVSERPGISRATFRDTLQCLPDGAVLTDLLGNILCSNRELLNVWGPGTVLQDSLSEGADWISLSEAAGVAAAEGTRRRAALESTHELVERLALSNGVNLIETSRPLLIENVAVGRLWLYRPCDYLCNDVLDGLSLREVTDLMPQLVFICERNGMNIYFNQSWVDYTGLSQEESRGHGWTRAFHQDDQAAGSHAIGNGPGYELECRLRRFDGEYRWFLIRALPLRAEGDEVKLWLGTCTDIADLKRAETELRATQDDLEGRVEDRTMAMQFAIREAEAASRAKSDFLSRMSHELRTPLNAILGFGQLLEMEDLDDDARESVQLIVKSGRYLLQLINEVLDLAKIEAGSDEVELSRIDGQEVILDSLELIRVQAEARQIQIHYAPQYPSTAFVLADQRRLQQVVVNLLSNAVKYNREQGEIFVALEHDTPGHLQISIRDTGKGMSSWELGRLFSPFERLGAANTGVEGTGLGLAFAKQLMTAMGGRISVRSLVDSGTTFTIELRHASALPAEPELASSNAPGSEGHGGLVEILIATESEPFREVLEAHFRCRREAKLVFCRSMAQAMNVKPNRIDAILFDLELESVSREDVNRLHQHFPETPIIALSAFHSDHTRFAETDPFFAWSSKSAGPQELSNLLDQALVARYHAA